MRLRYFGEIFKQIPVACGQIGLHPWCVGPLSTACPNLSNNLNRRHRLGIRFGRLSGRDRESECLIKPDHFRRGAEHEAVFRRKLDGLLALVGNFFHREFREILRVPVVRNADHPETEWHPLPEFPGEAVHPNRAHMERDRIKARVLLVRRGDGEDDFGRRNSQLTAPRNQARQLARLR